MDSNDSNKVEGKVKYPLSPLLTFVLENLAIHVSKSEEEAKILNKKLQERFGTKHE